MTLENAQTPCMEPDFQGSMIRIEVAYATPDRQVLLSLSVPQGTTVAEGIELSAIRDKFSGINMDLTSVGIFSQKVSLDKILQEGDRIEIYRPLRADPRETRRQRALKG